MPTVIILALTQLIDLIPKLAAAGIAVHDLWEKVDKIVAENRVPLDAEWDELDRYVAERKAAFEAAAAPQP